MSSKTVHRTANTRRAAVEDMETIKGSWNLYPFVKREAQALSRERRDTNDASRATRYLFILGAEASMI
jgi:hypothetical protein